MKHSHNQASGKHLPSPNSRSCAFSQLACTRSSITLLSPMQSSMRMPGMA
ncbi:MULTISPECIES: hypothetical protein [unclassified Anaerobiospirillum]|nr:MULTISPECIES: hypothetical protein [unclassified Anaerobiospirillum]MCK0535061.1 hypothetical protein [Anaerobiospirillum sp. NML120511]MCK0540186.1 hypothetical protein [Anaerobiospirillum sp. NML02-A-032]